MDKTETMSRLRVGEYLQPSSVESDLSTVSKKPCPVSTMIAVTHAIFWP